MASDQPIKFCECGCGQPAPIAPSNHRKHGHIKGQYLRFIHGHNARDHRDLWDRIRSRCVSDGDCLIWQGAIRGLGYGAININGRNMAVHRVVYEYFNGPIPHGLQLDHVRARGCRSRLCCNVDHLEPVTPRINVLRGDSVGAVNASKTHCPRGHEYTSDNLQPYALQHRGHRVCLICARSKQTKRQETRRQNGQCFKCNSPRDPKSTRLCTQHLLKERSDQNAYLRRRKAKGRLV